MAGDHDDSDSRLHTDAKFLCNEKAPAVLAVIGLALRWVTSLRDKNVERSIGMGHAVILLIPIIQTVFCRSNLIRGMAQG